MLPKHIHKDLDQINRQFFWNKDLHYKPLIGWDKICCNENDGGLGIKKSEHANITLQMKLLWKKFGRTR